MIETRTFAQIWNDLDERTRYDLRDKILTEAKIQDTTLRNYRNGHRRPDILRQDIIAKCIMKVLKVRTKPEYLFPNQK